MLKTKTTSKGRQPQNIKSWISQQPQIGFSSNLKLKLRGPNQNQKYSKQRQHPMEEDIKILKVEYITNRWTDFLKTLNLSLGNQTKNKMLKTKTTTRGGRPKKIESWIYQQPLIGFSSNLKLERQPQNIKCWISQQPLVGSSSTFKLTLRGPN